MAFSSVPSKLGSLVIRNVLCTTGAGALLNVEDTRLGRQQTVMLFDPDLPAWPRRLRDRQVLPAHPRLCLLSSRAPAQVRHEDRTFYYVKTERLCGWTVLDELARDGALRPLERAVRLCAEAAEALSCAHAAGLFHGHLEPGCLFVQTHGPDDEGHIKLLGAGLKVTAAPASRAARYRLSKSMARTARARMQSDVTALGAILYHMLSGQVPEPQSLDLTRLARGLPEALGKLLVRALSPSPGFATAGALHEALMEALDAIRLPPRSDTHPLSYRGRMALA